jgi:SAM-dependent methyltransferase
VALDPRVGSRHGLGVYPIARYLRVQADLTQLPLARGAFDWLVFQQGLTPLARDRQDDVAQQAAFEDALRALRPGGWLAVMNMPEPTAEENEVVYARFEEAGLLLMARPKRLGWRARMMELRGRLAGREPDIPPVLVAQKPG